MPDSEFPIDSPPHGFGDDERTRLLRCRPPDRALRWAASVRGVLTRLRWLRGGSSSALHALWFDDGSSAVLRRYVLPSVIEEEPDLVPHEVAALEAARRSSVRIPVVLAADETGTEADVPAVLMSRLPGRVIWAPASLEAWLRGLAVSPAMLSVTPPPRTLPPFRPYPPASWEPPTRMRDRSLWDRAIELFHSEALDSDRVLLHRDYHPGNVLWSRGQLSGVVDWQAACVGPPSVDAAWCRINLIRRFGTEVADRFIRVWEQVSGRSYHPWAEAVLLVDVLGWPHRHDAQFDELESSLARMLTTLGW